jgi:hypothetical protein
MVLATVEFTLGSRTVAANLHDDGWECSDSLSLEPILNRTCGLDRFDAQGAAEAAARKFNGTIAAQK